MRRLSREGLGRLEVSSVGMEWLGHPARAGGRGCPGQDAKCEVMWPTLKANNGIAPSSKNSSTLQEKSKIYHGYIHSYSKLSFRLLRVSHRGTRE